ncbi:MAG: DUF3108 domain-containing protein [Betaproteobacteria bacterium AqS2]|uniref:DUF3108 domain-containing protein n=1 Tax=Candidatus Amphirhobacter heronislandensis TaxID=1732024 RepID=A0A930XXI8_9GAMM|nr:DUF3108 domain-containing protein [Betaproteobacteria bacterium AqS2]
MTARRLALALCLLPLGAAAAEPPPPATLSFTMLWNGIEIAYVTDVIEFSAEGYRIASAAEAVGLAKLMGPGSVSQRSEGTLGAAGELRPARYEMRRGDDDHRLATIDYAAAAAVVSRNGAAEEVELTFDQVHDSLSLLYDFYARGAYVPAGAGHLTDGRRLRDYEFVADPQPATVTVAAGAFAATRYENIGEEDRNYAIWFADAHRRIPVHVLIERKGNRIEFLLTDFELSPE